MTDIRVNKLNWLKLRESALFFVPRLLDASGQFGVGQSDIVNASKATTLYKMGPPAVRSVFRCQPTTFHKSQSALNSFLSIINDRKAVTELSEKDIIACVIKVIGYTEVTRLLEISDADVAEATRFSLSLVQNVRRNGRVHLDAAASIVDFVSECVTNYSRKPKLTDNSELQSLVALYEKRDYESLLSSSPAGIRAIHRKDGEIDENESSIRYSDLTRSIRHLALYQYTW